MAKTQDIKRRIRSVRNTMQLTKAMKMVAASKLRRSQDRILRARPYSVRVHAVLRSLAARADPESHPLLQVHGDRKLELVVFTADKGLCGAFNSGVIRLAETFARGNAERSLSFNCVGKKARDYFARRGVRIVRAEADAFRIVEFATAKRIAEDLIQRYVGGELDAIHLVYNEFKSAIQARPVVERLLPIEPEELGPDQTSEEYIHEPSADELYAALLPHYVENRVFHAMLESAAAEHAARMAAMDAASKNAAELIDSLTLTMNRVRQASITTEIIEVVSGAQALR
jgi:F-type H+-transporting ATPase subunit gamma